MARLPDVTPDMLAPEHRHLMKRDIALYRQLAHSPGALAAFQGLGQYIRYGAKCDPRLRELAILQVGYLARSAYEWSHHVKIGHDFGVTDADIDALVACTQAEASGGGPVTAGHPSAGPLDALALSVLAAARAITHTGTVPQPLFDGLARSLGHEAMLDLVMTIAFYNAVVRVLATFRIEVEPDYQRYLDRHPLPTTPPTAWVG